uniref:Uncharacterized protein n=1 Tax=Oryza meridionalis TaxID=40149 RepID=A0A0E0CT56_9ORYZ
MASLASHELEGALKHGARVAEGAASGGVGDGNVEELGRRRRRLLRHEEEEEKGVLRRRIAAAWAWRWRCAGGGRCHDVHAAHAHGVHMASPLCRSRRPLLPFFFLSLLSLSICALLSLSCLGLINLLPLRSSLLDFVFRLILRGGH